jgi:hypothetical protein
MILTRPSIKHERVIVIPLVLQRFVPSNSFDCGREKKVLISNLIVDTKCHMG